ncbi:MAG: TauD/TfdA family dioxygenase [Acidobacteria bacterium]|nr:TauD/TfdA family dioxygenase [Acidobacteriota bacterium]
MNRIFLSSEEVRVLQTLAAEIEGQYTSVDDPAFLIEVPVMAHEVPRRVRTSLNHFRHLESPSAHCLISGYPVDDSRIGPTPSHWKSREGISPTLREEILFVLFGSLLGEVIGWATQQNGYIIHDVLPIKSDENAQISTGSQQPIWWHNEDAFHPYRGDYVGLLCLRNAERVATTLAPVSPINLSSRHLKILFEPRFIIRPDDSHAEKNGGAQAEADDTADTLKSAYDHIRQMQCCPQKLAVLSGDPRSPFIRIDPYFMDSLDDDEAQSALNSLIRAIDANLSEVVLQPGDYLFVDNYRAVHGRKSFTAKYDGSDRWLKRANITRDLRKSRASRAACTSHIIM